MELDERLERLTWSGWGKILFRVTNQRYIKCSDCGHHIPSGEGMRFCPERGSGERRGYLCSACIAKVLRRKDKWQYNSFIGDLFPLGPYAVHEYDGTVLANTFLKGGVEGLDELLMSVRRGIAS